MKPSYEELERELQEARQFIDAVRKGEVDTIISNQPNDGLLRLEAAKLVDERNRLLAELKKANIKLEQSDRLKDNFLRNMSHEMKSPLTEIIGYSEILLLDQEFNKNEDAHQFLESIHLAGERFLGLVENLFDLSRLLAGTQVYHKDNLLISLPVYSAVGLLKSQIEQKQIQLIINRKHFESTVYCDCKQIERVVINLLENAIMYSEERSEIELAGRKEDQQFRVTVKDFGRGIHKEELLSVFSQFTQPKQMKSGYVQRHGLGLAITRQIVEDHGGKIWAESKGLGKGTVFTFTLPLAST